MTTENKEELCRLLFVIIRHLPINKINWEEVASDPFLLRPISTAHSARMRYSRYRDNTTGHKPKKRNLPLDKSGHKPKNSIGPTEKYRVTKPKKMQQDKGKGLSKSESATGLSDAEVDGCNTTPPQNVYGTPPIPPKVLTPILNQEPFRPPPPCGESAEALDVPRRLALIRNLPPQGAAMLPECDELASDTSLYSRDTATRLGVFHCRRPRLI